MIGHITAAARCDSCPQKSLGNKRTTIRVLEEGWAPSTSTVKEIQLPAVGRNKWKVRDQVIGRKVWVLSLEG